MHTTNTLALLGIRAELHKGPARVSYLRRKWAERFGATAEEVQTPSQESEGEAEADETKQISSLLVATKSEIAAQAKEITSVSRDDCAIEDEETVGFSPTIAEEKVSLAVLTEKEILLSREEKRALARDVAEMRKANHYAFALVPSGFFG